MEGTHGVDTNKHAPTTDHTSHPMAAQPARWSVRSIRTWAAMLALVVGLIIVICILRRPAQEEYYSILQVAPTADSHAIRKSYQKLDIFLFGEMFELHCHDDDARAECVALHTRWLQLRRAYEVLIDEESRAVYDGTAKTFECEPPDCPVSLYYGRCGYDEPRRLPADRSSEPGGDARAGATTGSTAVPQEHAIPTE